MGIYMKLAKRDERALLRVTEQENRRAKAHHSSKIDGNVMDSSEESSGKAIEDLISQKSLTLLKKLNIDISFLNISPDLWDRDDSYLNSQEIFQNFRVVNYTAERGVKLMQDFNGLLTVDVEQKKFLLQCFEDHREQYTDCKKATLRRKFD
ncbi:hypothetical protein AVEN_58225-1 [Araneus ventricosus]|uniref:Uncharacterized protein n=1 Tax=Araneus ventricosus TaxID=182803 RepID=A0A4Y2JQG7_ARAVE|nr:hypothetical protein AVEN_58225-1 [Araneus ventricosus]